MSDQLSELISRHEELVALMSQPETATDPQLLARYGRELARLDPIVDALRQREEADRALTSARTHLEDADPEVRDMARGEARGPRGPSGGAGRRAPPPPGPP